MKKRLIAMLLILAMVLCMVPSVSAAAYSGTCGSGLEWSFDTDTGVLHITGSGPMNDYDQNGPSYPWRSYRTQIKTVIIDEGCTRVGNYAFLSASNITSLNLPDSITSIGKGAFLNCAKLVDFAWPEQLTTISGSAFNNCDALTSLTIPDTVTTLGASAFYDCDGLTTVVIPGNVTTIPENAFMSCGSLTNLMLEDGIQTIGSEAFYACQSLKSVTIPCTVISIGGYAFAYCDSLVIVNILGAETLGDNAFANCGSLKKATLPDNLKTVGYYCFDRCPSLTHIRFPASVTSISNYVLRECSSLVQVVIENPECSIHTNAALGVVGTATIFGYVDSTAQTYARNNGYLFRDISLAEEEPEVQVETDPEPTPEPAQNPEPTQITFTDVNEDAFYADAVTWAVENDITTGMTPTTFEPNTSCTRGQVVTFLWRAAGSPAPKSTSCNFTDVKEGAYYYKAMLWAVENGVTTGMTATTFAPNATCTRAQVVTFLWRAMGKEAPKTTTCNFTDVNPSGFYYKAMLWAVENGITSGMSATTFAPDSSCTRGQVVTFLYRTYN